MATFERWVLGYLVNSLWQAPLVFAAAWLAARLARRAGPRMEHRIWASVLVAEAVLPGVQLRLGDLAREAWGLALRLLGGGAVSGGTRIVVAAGPGLAHGGLRLPAALLTVVAAAYALTVLYFAARLAWGYLRTAAMRREAEPVVPAGVAATHWEWYGREFGYVGAQLAVSPRVPGPVTVGGRCGTMLVPPGFLERVEAEDLEAVMAHELAHMRRRDFAKNLLYGVLALPVAYHPALWLTRTRVAASREMVCDAMAAEAVQRMGGREQYARSLLRLAALIVDGRPVRTLHAIGIFDPNLFERRVMRLTERTMEATGVRRWATIAVCVGMGVATCGTAMALRVDAPFAQKEAGTVPETHGPARISGGIMAGQVLTKVNPVYPPDAKEAKIQGAVVLKAIISRQGVVENLQVVSGPKELRAASLDAVRQWVYKPYLLNGEPVEVETTITVTYSFGK